MYKSGIFKLQQIGTVAPFIESNGEILVIPKQFSAKQLYAIMNYKIKDGDEVRFIVTDNDKPRLDKYGKITLVPVSSKKYDREEVLDLLESFGKALRLCKDEDVNVEDWLDEQEGYKMRLLEIGLKTNPAERDEEIPYLLTKGEL